MPTRNRERSDGKSIGRSAESESADFPVLPDVDSRRRLNRTFEDRIAGTDSNERTRIGARASILEDDFIQALSQHVNRPRYVVRGARPIRQAVSNVFVVGETDSAIAV